ncbi:unnamed protein product [Thelazia callipaeda]|uniref:Acyl-CoA-binding domain-containing protein 6 n=1 Tax=Thelazia callipaeda TaxID=103827 RepID=A0A0N5CYF4_THECL|nr:unnamed protein product [Thelazia callipaeda]
MEETIRQKLTSGLKPYHLEIEDISNQCGLKFCLTIVSDSFNGITRLASHRLVHDVLKDEMDALHALVIKTYTRDQWDIRDMFVYQLLKWTSDNPTSEDEQSKEEISEQLRSKFVSACTYLPTALSEFQISRKNQLYFYARYKLVTDGKADPSKRPKIYDVIAREKFDAWLALDDMSRAEAMRQYIAKMIELNLGWNGTENYHSHYRMRPSTMADSESIETESSQMSMEQLEWFDALDEGNIDKLKDLLDGNPGLLEERDENQLTALHWASDRGKLELVEFLTGAGANVNIQDYDGQTPLHYAVSCTHRSVVDFLLRKGADPVIADFEGNCPLDIVSDAGIKKMLENALGGK